MTETLGLEIRPQIMGRAPGPFTHALVRVLRPEDCELLAALPRPTGQAPPLQRLSNRHHSVARLLAQGYRPSEAATIVGYSYNRISILQNDPAFKELVEFYRTSADREARSNFERLSGLAADAADLLQERMEEKPEEISNGQLLEIIKVGADRSGNGPSSSNVNININANIAEKMKAAREQARAASAKQIEGEARDA